MIAFLISTLLSFLVVWWLLRRVFPDVPVSAIEPPPPAVTVYTRAIVIHVHLPKGEGN